MFHPLPVFVGLRYVRTRRQGFFVSFISWISMAGVCLGVAALITIISVMNGFEGELRNRLVSLTAHATVSGPPGGWVEAGTAVVRIVSNTRHVVRFAIAGVHIDAVPVHYDAARFIDRFLANWPAGSPAHVSYYRRIIDGPAYAAPHALGLVRAPSVCA